MQPLAPGTLLHDGRYQIIDVIDRNELVITYLADSNQLHRQVIVKEFYPSMLCDRDQASNRLMAKSLPAAQDMSRLCTIFLEDAVNNSKVSATNVSAVIDVFKENSTAYYVTEHIEGQTLESILKESLLPTFQAVRYISRIAESLATIHSLGLLHLNVRPENIIIRARDNEPVLTNLGILRKHTPKKANNGNGYNTPTNDGFSPIEWYSDDISFLTPKSDLYSLTATLYMAITQQTPPEPLEIVQQGELRLPPYISPSMQAFIRKGMAIAATERFASADEYIEELLKAFNGGNKDLQPEVATPVMPTMATPISVPPQFPAMPTDGNNEDPVVPVAPVAPVAPVPPVTPVAPVAAVPPTPQMPPMPPAQSDDPQPAADSFDSFDLDIDMDFGSESPATPAPAGPAEFPPMPEPPAGPTSNPGSYEIIQESVVADEPIEDPIIMDVASSNPTATNADRFADSDKRDSGNQRKPAKRNKNVKGIVMIVGLMLLIIAGVGAVFFFQMSESGKNSTSGADDDDLLLSASAPESDEPKDGEMNGGGSDSSAKSTGPITVKDMPAEFGGLKALYTGPATADSIPDGADAHIEFTEGPLKSYTGELVKGEVTGKGKVVYKTGDVFTGTLRNTSFVEGTLRYASGKYYTGTFENDVFQNGTWYNSDGKAFAKVVNGKEQQL